MLVEWPLGGGWGTEEGVEHELGVVVVVELCGQEAADVLQHLAQLVPAL